MRLDVTWHVRLRLWLAILVGHDILRLPEGYGVYYPMAEDEYDSIVISDE